MSKKGNLFRFMSLAVVAYSRQLYVRDAKSLGSREYKNII